MNESHGVTGPSDQGLADAIGVGLLQALNADPHIGVSVVTESGVIVYTNARCTWLHFRDDRTALAGQRFDELFSAEWTAERLGYMRRVLTTRRSLVIRHIRRGAELHTTLHPIDTPPGAERRVLGLTVETCSSGTCSGNGCRDHAHLEVVESNQLDLGELDVLTRREIEVLALLGNGLSRGEIADALYRSPKTIDKHLESIATKLRISSRLQLARVAQRAGLTIRDSDRPRTHE